MNSEDREEVAAGLRYTHSRASRLTNAKNS